MAGADHNDLALLEGEKLIEAVVELAERVCEAPEPGVLAAHLAHQRRRRDLSGFKTEVRGLGPAGDWLPPLRGHWVF
jgi:hypothetical protein